MRKFLLSIFATCLLVLTFSVVPAAADGDYKVYMQLDGISGDSTNKIYSKWIELTNVEFKISGKRPVLVQVHPLGKSISIVLISRKTSILPPFH